MLSTVTASTRKLYQQWLDLVSDTSGGENLLGNLLDWTKRTSTDEAVELLVALLSNPGHHKRKNTYVTVTANQVFTRTDLTSTHAVQLAEVFLQYASSPALRNELTFLFSMDVKLLSLISSIDGCDLPTMGSLCRLVDQHGVKVPVQSAKETCRRLLEAKTCPVEVIARILTLPGRDGLPQSTVQGSYWGKNFQQVAAVAYPDLAGLPTQLITQVVASQPIPDAWFVNMWDADNFLPAGSSHPPPQWGSPWGEVVAER